LSFNLAPQVRNIWVSKSSSFIIYIININLLQCNCVECHTKESDVNRGHMNYDLVWSCKWLPTFFRNILRPHTKNEGIIFLWNAGKHLQHHTVLQPRDHDGFQHREKLEYHTSDLHSSLTVLMI
jgi:hypothetical protein